MKEEIKNLVRESIKAAKLMAPDDLADTQIEISRTKNPDHGHFSCNIALQLSKKLGLKILKDEASWQAKYPNVALKIEKLEARIKQLEDKDNKVD